MIIPIEALRVWEIEIMGQPAAQARPRFAGGRAYRTGRSVQWESNAAALMAERWEGPPLSCPVSLSVVALFERPQRMRWKRKPMPRTAHTSRPDLDNVLKSTGDSLELAGVVASDATISRVVAWKGYAAGNEAPRVIVRLEWGHEVTP